MSFAARKTGLMRCSTLRICPMADHCLTTLIACFLCSTAERGARHDLSSVLWVGPTFNARRTYSCSTFVGVDRALTHVARIVQQLKVAPIVSASVGERDDMIKRHAILARPIRRREWHAGQYALIPHTPNLGDMPKINQRVKQWPRKITSTGKESVDLRMKISRQGGVS